MSESRRSPPALGPRGEGWVILQFVLFLLLGVAGILGPRWPDALRWPVLGAAFVLGLAGVVLLLRGVSRLGAQLTPFPKPVQGSALREDGVYGLARHPIYGGGVMISLAWSFATSYWAIVPSALLCLLFEAKSRREELWLVEHHPAYEDYRGRVRRRFIPYLW